MSIRQGFGGALLAGLLCACGGSEPAPPDQGLNITDAALDWNGSAAVLTVRLEHRFPPELLDALHQGVNLRYVWRLELLGEPRLIGPRVLASQQGAMEVSFRSFTRWYTVFDSLSGRRIALPDIAQAERAFDRLEMELPELDLDGPPAQRARFRIELDLGALPPPLRLPAYLSPTWRQDSHWYEWSLAPPSDAASG